MSDIRGNNRKGTEKFTKSKEMGHFKINLRSIHTLVNARKAPFNNRRNCTLVALSQD